MEHTTIICKILHFPPCCVKGLAKLWKAFKREEKYKRMSNNNGGNDCWVVAKIKTRKFGIGIHKRFWEGKGQRIKL